MNTTDPIADMLTRIRNAVRSRHAKVEMPSSRMKLEIAKILKEEGYIAGYKAADENRRKLLRISLKYGTDHEPAVTNLVRVSKPGRRVYSSYQDVPAVLGGLGHSVLSTPRGVMTARRARKLKVGGEVLFEVW
jgi:small subunit ribosomal protein S8